jgi:hypothetical protein
MEKNMSDDISARESSDPVSAMWDINREFSPGDPLHLDWLSEMPEIPPAPECCTEIVGAIDQLTTAVREIEACYRPAADAPTADIHKRMDDIEREIRKATQPTPLDQVSSAESVFGYIYGLFAGALGAFAGVWAGLEIAHLQEVYRRLAADPADLKNWSAERLEGLEELDRYYPKSQRDGEEGHDNSVLNAFFRQAWLEWQRAIRKLIENIESPDSSQHLREESLRVMPDVLDDIERALELYRKRHEGREAPFAPELLDRAKELLQRTPPVAPEPDLSEEDGSDLLSRKSGGRRGRASEHEDDLLTLASYSADAGRGRSEPDRAQERFERVMDLVESLAARLRDPVRLEVRVLDDRVIARRLDGNRSVDVDLSRGYRMVGYMSV